MMLSVEETYSETAGLLNQEWESKYIRDQIRKQIKDYDSVQDLANILLRLDTGFCKPFYLKNLGDQEEPSEVSTFGDKNVKRV